MGESDTPSPLKSFAFLCGGVWGGGYSMVLLLTGTINEAVCRQRRHRPNRAAYGAQAHSRTNELQRHQPPSELSYNNIYYMMEPKFVWQDDSQQNSNDRRPDWQ